MVEQSYRITDPATLRALAHPLRQRILLELSVRHSARAADLADIVGEPANAISYHLRALAKAKLLVEAPELARDSRDRVWKLAHPEGVYVQPDAANPNPDPFTDDMTAWVTAMLNETVPENPGALRGRYLGAALLTREEAKTMFLEVADVLERWRLHGMDAVADNPRDLERVFHNVVTLVGNRVVDAADAAATGAGDSANAGATALGEPTTTVS